MKLGKNGISFSPNMMQQCCTMSNTRIVPFLTSLRLLHWASTRQVLEVAKQPCQMVTPKRRIWSHSRTFLALLLGQQVWTLRSLSYLAQDRLREANSEFQTAASQPSF